MNSLINGNRKKNRSEKERKKKKRRKQKAQLTKEYKEMEEEVQKMLAAQSNMNLSLTSQDIESDTQSADFFCSTSAALQIDSPLVSNESLENDFKYEDDEEEEGEGEEEEENYGGIEKQAIRTTASDEGSLQSENRTVASTYIQIDALPSPLTHAIVKQKHFSDPTYLLYKPSSQLHAHIVLPAEVSELTSSVVRMLNRYYEENHQLPEELIKCLTRSHILLAKGNYLYRTFCAKQFRPIFCHARAELVQIPTRHLLKLELKSLQLTEHPEILQEHRLANALRDLYDEYVRHGQEQKRKQLFGKLSAERAVMQEMLQQAFAVPEGQLREEKQVARQMLLVQKLRQQVYDEEEQRRELLQQILDNWLMLKKLRKSQKQQYTRFKLRINVTPVDANNWMKRYEYDLQEIYGEKLELFYRQQRLRKKLKKRSKKGVMHEKPVKPHIKDIAKELREMYNKLFGGPIIEIQRCDYNQIELMPSTQKTHSYFMRIFLDGQIVGNTRTYRLEPDFSLNINETFGIVLERRLPKEIYISLHEKSKFPRKSKLAKILIPLNAAQPANMRKKYSFTAKHEPIAGYLSVGLSYEPQTDVWSNIGVQPLEMVKQTQAAEELSDDDVADEARDVVDSNTCSFEEERLMLCSMDELKGNRRLQLLHSRYLQNDARTKDLRFIPALENEVVWEWYNNTFNNEHNVVDMGNWMEPIDLQRHQGKKYLKSLYEAIVDQCVRLSKVMVNGDNLILGDEPGNWGALFDAIVSLFRRTPPLAAPLRERNQSSQVMSGESNHNCKLTLTVVRATGIPVRNSDIFSTHEQQQVQDTNQQTNEYFRTQNFKYANVNPFVALIFKDKMCRTLASEGSNPTWNEQLVLQLNINTNDLREDIKIALFDEVIESQFTDDVNIRNVDVYQRIQTNWLGEYRLPISTLLQQPQIEGVLELKTPQVLIGYKRASLASEMENSVSIDTELPKFKEAVYLWYYISVEPVPQLAKHNTSCLECSELREVRQQLAMWTLQVRELQPHRYINPLICTADGKRVCLTRLIEAIPLPFQANDDHSLEYLCRFVSHLNVIRRYGDWLSFKGIWLNNKIVLDTTWCSAKDLGVLLCNLLLASGRKVWLVLGTAVPHGDATFVLYYNERATGGLELCDPCSGKRYNVKDVFCPLMKIYCVVSQDNIYCNIQSEMRVFMTNFNFNDMSCWLPAFTKASPAPIGGEQHLNYVYRDSLDTSEIRLNIERKIIKKISSWRIMRKTLWNRAFQSRLYKILQELEQNAVSGETVNEDYKYTKQLAAEFPGYKFYGFTLNVPYTNLTAISDYIKVTAIHLNSDKNVEFAVAVHLEVFPNNIISVWIFLLSITPNMLIKSI